MFDPFEGAVLKACPFEEIAAMHTNQNSPTLRNTKN
jgi:hypothetical protein